MFYLLLKTHNIVIEIFFTVYEFVYHTKVQVHHSLKCQISEVFALKNVCFK